MKMILLSIHLIISLLLMTFILIQSGKGGLGRSFGGDIIYRSKRGVERVVFIGTFILAFLFFITSILNMLVR
ncbi:MAG: preprotein translocase subunit SecG [Patescibacteria group bacterium]|nr:preprotein translocase subunit SecG [Patescibacteria group bacterium]